MASGPWGGALNQRVFRVNIQFTRGAQLCQTGFHVRDVGLPTLDAEEVADAVSPFVTTQFVKLLHTADQVIGLDVENLVSREGHSISYASTPGVAGGTPNPSFITLPISLKGSIRRRYGSGRMLWPVPVIEHMVGNGLHGSAQPIFAAVVADLWERLGEGGLLSTMRLVHVHDTLPVTTSRPEVPASWYDITSIRMSTRTSSLKRRKAGVGN